ncbi:MAG: AraC family transcriptional regulator [Bacteroidetes bacterium]|nr:AraC family transcriptional regulator [Bacteroidota bacterium]
MKKMHLHLTNMHCDCCVRVVRMDLEQIGVQVLSVEPGQVSIQFNSKEIAFDKIEEVLGASGFSVIKNKEAILVEDIRQTVITLVHHTTYNAMVRNSDYLVGKFGKTYPYLSSVFSKYEGLTLEKFIIQQKIEKARALIEEGELTLSEIAFMMGYSSVQYLSTQFKNVTGISVTDYKKNPVLYRQQQDMNLNYGDLQ